MTSGRLVCICHDVFLWCYVCFILLRFRLLYAFVKAAALRSTILRYAGAPIATRVSFSFFGDVAFSKYFLYHFRFLFVWEYTSYVLSFRTVFFYLVTTDWIFDISLCENSINSTNQNQSHLPNANPARGHKEVQRSTVHIMVTTRYSNPQGFKP